MIERMSLLNPAAIDWSIALQVLPELLLLFFGIVLVALDLFVPRQRQLLPWLTIVSVLVVLFMDRQTRPGLGGDMLLHDGYATFFITLCLCSVLLTVLMREFFTAQTGEGQGEFYSLLVFSAVGMMVMSAAVDLMTIYLGLELMALPIYVLIGMHKKELRTSEAAAKYFLMGVFASSLLLFGMSLLYGLSGTTSLIHIGAYLQKADLAQSPALLVALGLMIAGFCFKAAVVPFHLWTPDVYEGAPSVVTAFMSVGPKAAAFAVFGRVMLFAFPSLHFDWGTMLSFLAVLSMALGNVAALAQTSLKRMLAYSSIAHAGYALLGIAAGTANGMAAAMSYLFIYLFMNMGAFAILILLSGAEPGRESIESCKGLAARHPLLALSMLIFMFSLTGIPPTGGFTGKFYLFQTALAAGYTWAVVAGAIFSAVSAYFYLRIIRLMYMNEAPVGPMAIETSKGMLVVLGIAVAGVLYFGIAPGTLFNWAQGALLP